MSLRKSCSESVVMSGFRSSACFGAAATPLAGLGGHRVGGCLLGGIDVLDQFDPLLLEVAVEVLDVGLVEVDLGDRRGDVAESQHPELLAPGDEALYLFKFLEFSYEHPCPIVPLRGLFSRAWSIWPACWL